MDIRESQKLLARSLAKRRQCRSDAREEFAYAAGHQQMEKARAQTLGQIE